MIKDYQEGRLYRVGLVYMLTGFIVFFLMGILGFLMRAQQAGMFQLGEVLFYQFMTLHGLAMPTSVLLGAMGGFAIILGKDGKVKLSIPFLWTIFIIYFLGAGFVIYATLLGGFATGWTMLHPLPLSPGPSSVGVWNEITTVVAFTGVAFVAVSFLLYCIHIMVATSKAYGGMTKALAWEYLFSFGKKEPKELPRAIDIIAVVVAIDGIITVLSGVFYLVPLYAIIGGIVSNPLDFNVVFAKNLLYIFGHTLVNLNIYLAAGLVYVTLPEYTGRPWKTSWPVVAALNSVIILVLMPAFHHVYQDFPQPLFLHIIGQIGSYGVAIPALVVTIVGGLTLIYRSGMKWSVPSIMMAVGLWGWVFGGIGAVIDATIGVNNVMHNTMWVPAHFHGYYLIGAAFFVWAYFYHVVARLSGFEETAASKAAAILFSIGAAGFDFSFFLSGAFSVPRRFAVYQTQWQMFAMISLPFIMLIGLGVSWLGFELLTHLKPSWDSTKHPTPS